MNKSELIEQLAKEAGITKTEARSALQSILESMSQELGKEKGRVTLQGFGSFSAHERKPRTGRHPKTGEMIEIDGYNTVKFKPGKNLKESL
jgi:DNA-binding protein HU-beta